MVSHTNVKILQSSSTKYIREFPRERATDSTKNSENPFAVSTKNRKTEILQNSYNNNNR